MTASPSATPQIDAAAIPPQLRRMIPVLALLGAVAPLATDMYLAAMPQMAEYFAVDAAHIQLSLTAFLLGLAIGQLVIGPLSDGWGRRRPLLVGTLVCLLATLACLFAPNIEVLTVARFVQGASGAAGLVLSRAIIADCASGPQIVKVMGMMMLIGGTAPIVAPVAGSLLLEVGNWQLVFGVLAALVVLMIVGVLALVPETLAPEARHTGGLHALLGSAGEVLGNRQYLGYVGIAIGAFGALFAYISASPFVMQNVLGLSPRTYGIVFGINACGLLGCSLLTVRMAGRVAVGRQLAFGIGVHWCASALLLASLWLAASPALVLGLLWLAVASLGLVLGNTSALALSAVPQWRGTASAFLGCFQFGIGALVSPLVGIAGTRDARPMALAMLLAASVAALALTYVGSRRS